MGGNELAEDLDDSPGPDAPGDVDGEALATELVEDREALQLLAFGAGGPSRWLLVACCRCQWEVFVQNVLPTPTAQGVTNVAQTGDGIGVPPQLVFCSARCSNTAELSESRVKRKSLTA